MRLTDNISTGTKIYLYVESMATAIEVRCRCVASNERGPVLMFRFFHNRLSRRTAVKRPATSYLMAGKRSSSISTTLRVTTLPFTVTPSSRTEIRSWFDE